MNRLYATIGTALAGASMLAGAAQADGIEKRVASPILTFENIRISRKGNETIYYYDRVFRESSGVGVNLTGGKLCYTVDKKCSEGEVNYKIPPKGELRLDGKEFWTYYDKEELTIEYWGKDTNGNDIRVKAVINHPR